MQPSPPYVPIPVQAGPRAPTAKPVRLPAPTEGDLSRARHLCVVILADDSGSMYGAWGDPTGVRYAAAESLRQLMEQMGGGQMAVVHWGSNAPSELVTPMTSVRKGKRVLHQALRIPPTLGGNNFPAAVARARETVRSLDPDAVLAVMCLTDGIEQVGPDAEAELRRLPPNTVHVLLIDHSGGCDASLEAGWRRMPLGSFTRLDVLDTRRMAWQLAEIATCALGLQMPPDEGSNLTRKERSRR